MFRRLLQFRLRSLLLLTLLFAAPLGWYVRELRCYNAEEAAIEQLRRAAKNKFLSKVTVYRVRIHNEANLGSRAQIRSRAPQWLRPILSPFNIHLLDRVDYVSLTGEAHDDESLEAVAAFRSLRHLSIRDTRLSSAAVDRFCAQRPEVMVTFLPRAAPVVTHDPQAQAAATGDDAKTASP